MENSRYRDNNLGKGAGISRSDLTKTATMPKKKNKIGGFRIFETIRLKSMSTPHPSTRRHCNRLSSWQKYAIECETSMIM
jgi:hypothetical protein